METTSPFMTKPGKLVSFSTYCNLLVEVVTQVTRFKVREQGSHFQVKEYGHHAVKNVGRNQIDVFLENTVWTTVKPLGLR